MSMKLAAVARGIVLLVGVLALAACQHAMPPVAFHATDPDNLAAWHVLRIHDGHLQLNEGVVPYDVNTKLFSDYAYKLRTVWMPKGTSANYTAKGPLDFPVGTIISKTFYYPLPAGGTRNATDVAQAYADMHDFVPGKGLDLSRVHLIETRLLVRRKSGWVGIPYVWNDAQTEATLSLPGATEDLVLVNATGKRTPFTYVVPSVDQCAICHNYAADASGDASKRYMVPIGPTASHLNRDFAYYTGTQNQLQHWAKLGYLGGVPAPAAIPRNAQWLDPAQPLDARARAYLDANCAYCHNPHGEANYTALWLSSDEPLGPHTGLCKTPVAAGRATGNRRFDVVPGQPDASIMMYRIDSDQVGVMMPELGRTTVDHKGAALIRAWIASLKGSCTIIHGNNAAP